MERAREVKDSGIEAQACANLGITKMSMGQFEEAIGLFEQQLAMLEQVCCSGHGWSYSDNCKHVVRIYLLGLGL